MAIERSLTRMKQQGRWHYDSDESRVPNAVALKRAYRRLWDSGKVMSDAEARYHEQKSSRTYARPQ